MLAHTVTPATAAIPSVEGTIVAIHGAGCSQSDFRLLTPLLTAHYNVVTVDLPGHGASSPLGRNALSDCLGAVLGKVEELAVHGPVHLLGHSAGGLVGLLAASQDPEDIHSVNVIDSSVPATLPELSANRLRAVSPNAPDWQDKFRERMVSSWGRPDGSPVEASLLQGINEVTSEVAAALWFDVLQADAPEVWKRLPRPALYIRSDRAVQLDAIARANPLVETVDMKHAGVGHWPHLRQPALVAKHVLDFLGRIQSEN